MITASGVAASSLTLASAGAKRPYRAAFALINNLSCLQTAFDLAFQAILCDVRPYRENSQVAGNRV